MKLKIEYKWELSPEGFGQFITKSDAQATKVRLQRKLKYKKRVTKLPKTGNKRVTKCVENKKNRHSGDMQMCLTPVCTTPGNNCENNKQKREEKNSFPLLYLSRESNPNLIFRRDLFYPLNY